MITRKRSKLSKKSTRITKAKPDFVSLVQTGANIRPFNIIKADGEARNFEDYNPSVHGNLNKYETVMFSGEHEIFAVALNTTDEVVVKQFIDDNMLDGKTTVLDGKTFISNSDLESVVNSTDFTIITLEGVEYWVGNSNLGENDMSIQENTEVVEKQEIINSVAEEVIETVVEVVVETADEVVKETVVENTNSVIAETIIDVDAVLDTPVVTTEEIAKDDEIDIDAILDAPMKVTEALVEEVVKDEHAGIETVCEDICGVQDILSEMVSINGMFSTLPEGVELTVEDVAMFNLIKENIYVLHSQIANRTVVAEVAPEAMVESSVIEKVETLDTTAIDTMTLKVNTVEEEVRSLKDMISGLFDILNTMKSEQVTKSDTPKYRERVTSKSNGVDEIAKAEQNKVSDKPKADDGFSKKNIFGY